MEKLARVIDLNVVAISDSGPKHEVHVYVRRTGRIIWRKKAFLGSRSAHKRVLLAAQKVVDLQKSRMFRPGERSEP